MSSKFNSRCTMKTLYASSSQRECCIRQIHKVFQNVDTTTSNSQRCADFSSMLDSKFTSKHVMDVAVVTSVQYCNRNVKLTTFSRRRYYNVAATLYQFCKEPQTWTIHGHVVTFPQICFKVVKMSNNDMMFDPYSNSILCHQIQGIISLAYSKSLKKLLSKSLEMSK